MKKTANDKKLTRAILAEAIYQEIGISRREARRIIETTIDKIKKTLLAGENVKLSSFGSFIIKDKGERIGRNLRSGEKVIIPPRRVVKFRPSAILKKCINDNLIPK